MWASFHDEGNTIAHDTK
jgi:hypothetical protein